MKKALFALLAAFALFLSQPIQAQPLIVDTAWLTDTCKNYEDSCLIFVIGYVEGKYAVEANDKTLAHCIPKGTDPRRVAGKVKDYVLSAKVAGDTPAWITINDALVRNYPCS